MSTTNPLISVIVPCYNQSQYLPDALNSILHQTFPCWECIVVNDGSTDNSEKIANEWIFNDKRFKYLKKDHGGASSARNAGLNAVTGDFIQFLDSDDIIGPEKFEIQLKSFHATPGSAICISDYYYSETNDLSKPHKKWYLTPIFKTNNPLFELILDWQTKLSIPIHCFLFKSSLFRDNKIFFNETLPNHVDWECWMNIFRLKPEITYVRSKLAVYRIQRDGLSSNKEQMKKGYLKAIAIQKRKFDKNSKEYSLLTRKHLQIKFDMSPYYLLLGQQQIIYRNLVKMKGRFISSDSIPKKSSGIRKNRF